MIEITENVSPIVEKGIKIRKDYGWKCTMFIAYIAVMIENCVWASHQ